MLPVRCVCVWVDRPDQRPHSGSGAVRGSVATEGRPYQDLLTPCHRWSATVRWIEVRGAQLWMALPCLAYTAMNRSATFIQPSPSADLSTPSKAARSWSKPCPVWSFLDFLP